MTLLKIPKRGHLISRIRDGHLLHVTLEKVGSAGGLVG